MSRKYAFPSLKEVKREATKPIRPREEEEEPFERPKPKEQPRRPVVSSSEEEESSEELSSDGEQPKRRGQKKQRADLSEDDEAENQDDMEEQLLHEDSTNVRRKRLPELDFVLSFAHKRARELLRSSDDDDNALTTVVATWLHELEDRFETFEKQAAKFDEYESALLQSQRMHQKIRKQIAVLLKQEREMKRSLSETMVQNERKKRGTAEVQKAQHLLNAL